MLVIFFMSFGFIHLIYNWEPIKHRFIKNECRYEFLYTVNFMKCQENAHHFRPFI